MKHRIVTYLISLALLCVVMLLRAFLWGLVLMCVWNLVIVQNGIIAGNPISYWQAYVVCAAISISKCALYARGESK